MNDFLALFVTAIALSIVLNLIFNKIGLPTIIGYISTGAVLAYAFNVQGNHVTSEIAEFGVVFLMFTIGLEFSVKHLLSMKTAVFVNGGLQVLLTGFCGGFVLYYFFGFPFNVSCVIGVSLSFSSTAIVLKVLNDNGQISQTYGRKALGILLFQDIAVIGLLLAIDIIGAGDKSIGEILLKTAISFVVIIAALYLIGHFVLSRILRWVIGTNSQEIFIATIFFIVIGASFLAHLLGFSYTLGAFIAGMILAGSEFNHKIEADLIPFRDILLGFFFVTVGLQIDFAVIAKNWVLILSILVAILLIKIGIVYLILCFKNTKKNAIKTALSVCQIGEFALAVFTILSANRYVNSFFVQIFSAVTVLSMILTPFILRYISKFGEVVEKIDTSKYELLTGEKPLENHIIICGYGTLGKEVISKIKAVPQAVSYVILEKNINLVEEGRAAGEPIFYADATQEANLQRAFFQHATAIILALGNEHRNLTIANVLQNVGFKKDVMIHYKGNEAQELYENLGENFHLVSDEKAVARVLVVEALRERKKTMSSEEGSSGAAGGVSANDSSSSDSSSVVNSVSGAGATNSDSSAVKA